MVDLSSSRTVNVYQMVFHDQQRTWFRGTPGFRKPSFRWLCGRLTSWVPRHTHLLGHRLHWLRGDGKEKKVAEAKKSDKSLANYNNEYIYISYIQIVPNISYASTTPKQTVHSIHGSIKSFSCCPRSTVGHSETITWGPCFPRLDSMVTVEGTAGSIGIPIFIGFSIINNPWTRCYPYQR